MFDFRQTFANMEKENEKDKDKQTEPLKKDTSENKDTSKKRDAKTEHSKKDSKTEHLVKDTTVKKDKPRMCNGLCCYKTFSLLYSFLFFVSTQHYM